MSWVGTADERSDTLTFLNDVACSGPCTWPNVSIQIAGTFAGKAQFECSNDNVIWEPLELNDVSTSSSRKINTTTPLLVQGACFARYIRVLAIAYTSGTMAVTIYMRP